jgi:hypothetical protein
MLRDWQAAELFARLQGNVAKKWAVRIQEWHVCYKPISTRAIIM